MVDRGVKRSCMKTCVGWSVVAACTLVVSPWLMASGQESAALMGSSPPQPTMTGVWKGVYFVYPQLTTVKLIIQSAAESRIEGECEFYPAVESRDIFGPVRGSYHFTGEFDVLSGSFSINAAAFATARGTQMAPPIKGVLDPASGRLAGMLEVKPMVNPLFVVLARDAAGDELVKQITQSAFPPAQRTSAQVRSTPEQRPVAPVRQGRGYAPRSPGPQAAESSPFNPVNEPVQPNGFRPPSSDTINAWASRLKQEKPDIDTHHTVFEKLYLLARNLFADDYFKKFFGITYDNLTGEQRRAIFLFFNQHQYKDFSDYAFLDRAFMPRGTDAAPDITVSVFWQRTVRGWMNYWLGALRQLPPGKNSLSAIEHVESAAAFQLVPLWPSEIAEFAGAIAENRARLAGPVLERKVNEAIGDGVVEGAQKLSGWNEQEKQITQYAPKETKKGFATGSTSSSMSF
jgi:hypothetical protein